ncbi:DNA pilot protein [Tortoise microvirus 10]|nr:DNA pilot protein [Tortoise microvirus 10]QCS36998.1 DNA pilot protein [Tortoise microvirus 10]
MYTGLISGLFGGITNLIEGSYNRKLQREINETSAAQFEQQFAESQKMNNFNMDMANRSFNETVANNDFNRQMAAQGFAEQQMMNAFNMGMSENQFSEAQFMNAFNRDIASANLIESQGMNAFNRNMARESMDFEKAQFDWSKAQQEIQYNRQDTALQRAVSDAEMAGLSPLAALGSTGAGSTVSSPSFSAPSGTSGMSSSGAPSASSGLASGSGSTSGASLSSPVSSIGAASSGGLSNFRAAQYDFGGALDAFFSARSLALQERQLDIEEEKRLDAREKATLDRKADMDKAILQINASVDNVEKQIASSEGIANAELSRKITQDANTIKMFLESSAQQDSHATRKALSDNGIYNVRELDEPALSYARTAYAQSFSALLDKAVRKGILVKRSSAESTGTKGSVNVAGIAGGSVGLEDYESTSYDATKQWDAMYEDFKNTHYYPIEKRKRFF